MKTWLILMLCATTALAAEDWLAREFKEAERQLNDRQYARAGEVYHNLLLIHAAVPLSKDALQRASAGLAASWGRVKVDDPNSVSDAFVARVQGLGFEKMGAAWLPAELKRHVSADAVARWQQLASAEKCATCKGWCVAACQNCERGQARCVTCMGTGRVGGAATSSRGATCSFCNGLGKTSCSFCGGHGVMACAACSGLGVKK